MIRLLAESRSPESQSVLTPEALGFIARLHRKFGQERLHLLELRKERALRFAGGELPTLLRTTSKIRQSTWQIAAAPQDLQKRVVEITGPVEAKMMINALTSGADVFMADFEDSLSPTWNNIVSGQRNLWEAVRGTLTHRNPDGKLYELTGKLATLIVRPRGWHLTERNVNIDGSSVSASLFDFGLHFFHNAHELIARGSGPYFYLPKLESHLEARLWNDVFVYAQEELGIPVGTIRATVLIETLPAAFEMDEILWELKDHVSGLNAGRWDYLFSIIKKFSADPDFLLPDRMQLGMETSFMQAYCERLIRTCHRRGAHAMGGMSAFIPSRKDPEVNARALAKVREDKQRESRQGFDGTWVAHPDLVPIAREVFEEHLGDRIHQKEARTQVQHDDPSILLDFRVPGGKVTEEGLRNNASVALAYIEAWLRGQGAVAIRNLMEDAATAEIARGQIWQWMRHGGVLDTGKQITPRLYSEIRDEECAKLGGTEIGRMKDAVRLLDEIVLDENFQEFLTLSAYRRLEATRKETQRAS